jgi:hypothetical protein
MKMGQIIAKQFILPVFCYYYYDGDDYHRQCGLHVERLLRVVLTFVAAVFR